MSVVCGVSPNIVEPLENEEVIIDTEDDTIYH